MKEEDQQSLAESGEESSEYEEETGIVYCFPALSNNGPGLSPQ